MYEGARLCYVCRGLLRYCRRLHRACAGQAQVEPAVLVALILAVVLLGTESSRTSSASARASVRAVPVLVRVRALRLC